MCLNPQTLSDMIQVLGKITIMSRSDQAQCVKYMEQIKKGFGGGTIGRRQRIISLIRDQCAPAEVKKYDFDLRKYAGNQLEDDIYIYEIKVKTLKRYISDTDEEDLPDPSYAPMFLEYM